MRQRSWLLIGFGLGLVFTALYLDHLGTASGRENKVHSHLTSSHRLEAPSIAHGDAAATSVAHARIHRPVAVLDMDMEMLGEQMDRLRRRSQGNSKNALPRREQFPLNTIVQPQQSGTLGQRNAGNYVKDPIVDPHHAQIHNQDPGQTRHNGGRVVPLPNAAQHGMADHRQQTSQDAERAAVETFARVGLTGHYWLDVCSQDLDTLKMHPHYPLRPHHVKVVPRLQLRYFTESYAQRLMGLLHVPSNDEYELGITCNTCCELLLGSNASPSSAEVALSLCNGHRHAYQRTVKRQLHANEPVYLEVVHQHGTKGTEHLQVAYRTRAQPDWQILNASMLSPIHAPDKTSVLLDPIDSPWFATQQLHMARYRPGPNLVPSKLPFVSAAHIAQSLPSCQWRDPEARVRNVTMYEAANIFYCRESRMYPKQDFRLQASLGVAVPDTAWATPEMANSVINAFVSGLAAATGIEYRLVQPLSLHETRLKSEESQPARWYVDVVVRPSDKDQSADQRLSSYISTHPQLEYCLPTAYSWQPRAMVHVVVPLYNQGAWVLHLLENLKDMYDVTADTRFTLVLVDYGSTDLDVRAALVEAGLPHTRYVAAQGRFSRAAGVQLGIDTVDNAEDIVFTCDLHLEMPPHLLELIRQRTIKGRTAFNPIVARLDCGAYPSKPCGSFEELGYGLMSLYKGDLEGINGLRGLEHLRSWGGEDWVMLDRIMANGLECDRGRVDGFYHYFHSKTALWGSVHPVLMPHQLDFDMDPHSGYTLTTRGCTAEQPNAVWFMGMAGALRPAVFKELLVSLQSSQLKLERRASAPKAHQHFAWEHKKLKLKATGTCLHAPADHQVVMANCAQATRFTLTGSIMTTEDGRCLSWQRPDVNKGS